MRFFHHVDIRKHGTASDSWESWGNIRVLAQGPLRDSGLKQLEKVWFARAGYFVEPQNSGSLIVPARCAAVIVRPKVGESSIER